MKKSENEVSMKHSRIPKIIHYCWFGGKPLPDLAKKCIESWKKYCPDYEIREWNESNFDINCNKYVSQAYKAKKWAFVTDYVRLNIIYNHGGIYFDTDVELIKNIDELLEYSAFFAKEDDIYFNTGIGFGAIKKFKLIEKLMQEYYNTSFIKENGDFDLTTCPVRNTKIIKHVFGNFDVYKKTILDGICFLPKEYFCPIDYETGNIKITKNTVAIHHFLQSWLTNSDKVKFNIKKFLIKLVGKEKFLNIKRKIKGKE